MGQYHIVCNFTRKEFIYPHAFGDGLKLIEFGMSGSGTMTGLAVLLAGSNGRGEGDLDTEDHVVVGRWCGDAIGIVGDYHEPGDARGQTLPRGFFRTVCDEGDGWVDISEAVMGEMAKDSDLARDLAERLQTFSRRREGALTYDAATDTFRRVLPPLDTKTAAAARAGNVTVPAQSAGRTGRARK